jgi:hypothetical protein
MIIGFKLLHLKTIPLVYVVVVVGVIALQLSLPLSLVYYKISFATSTPKMLLPTE